MQVIVTDAATFKPFATYMALLREARTLDPESFAWRTDVYEFETERPAIDYLLGRDGLRERLERGDALADLERGFEAGLADFAERRRGYLLYD